MPSVCPLNLYALGIRSQIVCPLKFCALGPPSVIVCPQYTLSDCMSSICVRPLKIVCTLKLYALSNCTPSQFVCPLYALSSCRPSPIVCPL